VSDIKSIIGGARRPEKIVVICLRPDLMAEWQRATEELQRAKEAPRESLDDSGPVALARRVEHLEQEMRESSVEFVVRGIPPARVRAIQAESADDEALAMAVLRESLAAPDVDDDDWERLFGDDGILVMGEVARLVEASNAVNFRASSVPSSRLASALIRRSAES
jgi:hypothetical protein